MTTPTTQQMKNFYHLIEEGKVTVEQFQSFLDKHSNFSEESGYSITIDYSRPLSDMIKDGNYYYASDVFSSENFSIDGKGTADIKLRLIHHDQQLTAKQIEEHLVSLGLQSAKLEHLIAFGAKYPDKQREFLVYALGSTWLTSEGHRFVPHLCMEGSGRCLSLNWRVTLRYCPHDTLFLAVDVSK